MADRAPPSRARRLWVHERLGHARRAADLLDRKRQILRVEEQQARLSRDRAGADWVQAGRRAAGAALRAEALGGAWAVTAASHPVQGRATIEVDEQETAGVVHPAGARLQLPGLTGVQSAAAGPAVSEAAEAHAGALGAAARLAVAESALSRLRAERSITERRQRAVARVRIPALEEELRLLDERLEELERQDQVVVRWVAGRKEAGEPGTTFGSDPGPGSGATVGP